MRIAVVGPVTPYRSGIAKHTTELARAFSERGDVECRVISFSRQYPRWAYPGDDDRAADLAPLGDPAATYLLDSVSPMSWFGAKRDLTRFAPDAVIVPAWTFFVAPCLGWISWRLRRHGIPVVSVVHNVSDHEEAGWKMRLSLFQLRQAQVFVTHSSSLASALRARLAGVVANPRILVHPHPIFEQYPEPRIALPRRAGLELLFFGLVRPYKGLDVALRAIARWERSDRSAATSRGGAMPRWRSDGPPPAYWRARRRSVASRPNRQLPILRNALQEHVRKAQADSAIETIMKAV